jgi:hypothetical protein
MTTLKPNSIRDEYYFGDLPGNLQYYKSADELMNANTNLPMTDIDAQWTTLPATLESKRRLLPTTQRMGDWTLLLVMTRTTGAHTWLKGAFANKVNGAIALMTSASSDTAILERGNRTVKTHDGDYFVGHYRMGAPAIFWKTLQAILFSRVTLD